MLVISCVWCLALLCHLISLDMLCVNATCSVSNYHICEFCIAILLPDIIYVNYTMLSCCKGIIYVNYAMPCCLANHYICDTLFITGQFHHGPLVGQELHRASYGPKDVMRQTWSRSENGLESYWMAQMTLMGLIRDGCNGPWVSGL